MKKSEAEPIVRHLIHQWRDEVGEAVVTAHPSVSDFRRWAHGKGYSHYLEFRSEAGSSYDVELWFDQELKQTWRL